MIGWLLCLFGRHKWAYKKQPPHCPEFYRHCERCDACEGDL